MCKLMFTTLICSITYQMYVDSSEAELVEFYREFIYSKWLERVGDVVNYQTIKEYF